MLTTRYARRTLLLPGRVGRATVDTEHRCGTPSGRSAHLPDLAIVETKSGGKPGPLDHALWALGCRPMKVSKFGTGLAATRGGIPANKWHRVIPRLVTAWPGLPPHPASPTTSASVARPPGTTSAAATAPMPMPPGPSHSIADG